MYYIYILYYIYMYIDMHKPAQNEGLLCCAGFKVYDLGYLYILKVVVFYSLHCAGLAEVLHVSIAPFDALF